MATRGTNAPPPLNWKKIDRRLEHLDASGWRRELMRLTNAMHFRGVKNLTTNHRNVLYKTANKNVSANSITYVADPPVKLLTFQNGEGFLLGPDQLPAIVANLDAPDALLLQEFLRVLGIAREKYPAPVVSPGRGASHNRFGPAAFKKWRSKRIVALAYLILWRALQPASQRGAIPNRALGAAIGLGDKQTSESLATLRLALAALPALTAQVAYGN